MLTGFLWLQMIKNNKDNFNKKSIVHNFGSFIHFLFK